MPCRFTGPESLAMRRLLTWQGLNGGRAVFASGRSAGRDAMDAKGAGAFPPWAGRPRQASQKPAGRTGTGGAVFLCPRAGKAARKALRGWNGIGNETPPLNATGSRLNRGRSGGFHPAGTLLQAGGKQGDASRFPSPVHPSPQRTQNCAGRLQVASPSASDCYAGRRQ